MNLKSLRAQRKLGGK